MVAAIIFAILLLTMIAELWLGIVVVGWREDRPYVIRSEAPILYWTWMGVHFVCCFGLPLLAYAAGI